MSGEAFIQGRKLRALGGRDFIDDFGRNYFYEHGKLYEERAPGKWWWIRARQVHPVVNPVGERLLYQVEGKKNHKLENF